MQPREISGLVRQMKCQFKMNIKLLIIVNQFNLHLTQYKKEKLKAKKKSRFILKEDLEVRFKFLKFKGWKPAKMFRWNISKKNMIKY